MTGATSVAQLYIVRLVAMHSNASVLLYLYQQRNAFRSVVYIEARAVRGANGGGVKLVL